jgi:hypothetical protein
MSQKIENAFETSHNNLPSSAKIKLPAYQIIHAVFSNRLVHFLVSVNLVGHGSEQTGAIPIHFSDHQSLFGQLLAEVSLHLDKNELLSSLMVWEH